MFREMRKTARELTKEESMEMLANASHGVLAVVGDNGHPYGVPVNFTVVGDKILFHGASVGHKLDSIKANPKVSFTVIEKEEILPKEFNTLFTSVIVFGESRVLEDEEKKVAMQAIIAKYSGDYISEGDEYIAAQWENVVAIEISIENMTGKAGV